MDLFCLDAKTEGNAKCFLSRATLEEYVCGLPKNFEDYFVQRGIVSNKYLDNLWDTISHEKHIPQIVLVSNSEVEAAPGETLTVPQEKISILDGLQRSKRLKILWDTSDFIDNSLSDTPETDPMGVARQHSKKLKELECTPRTFKSLLLTKRERPREPLTRFFKKNSLWLEVWSNLNREEQIKKMLILNAGHKSVNIKHQIELLFINYLPTLEKLLPNSTIFREKHLSSISYSKNRESGQFHFSHLISSFESLSRGTAITTNSDFSANKSFEDTATSDELYDEYLDSGVNIMNEFAITLSELDNSLRTKDGVRWIGREVVLVGIFGSIGLFAENNLSGNKIAALRHFREHISEFSNKINLKEFEEERNDLELSKVNIGNVNKRAVFEATRSFLENPAGFHPDWKKLFSSNTTSGGAK